MTGEHSNAVHDARRLLDDIEQLVTIEAPVALPMLRTMIGEVRDLVAMLDEFVEDAERQVEGLIEQLAALDDEGGDDG